MITPQANLEGTDRKAEVLPAAASTPPAAEMRTSATQTVAPAAQHGSEMAWASLILLGTLVLLVGIGLWLAVASNIRIAAVLLGGALLVLVMVAVSNALDDATPLPQS